ncbi:mandelate racemase/muconate lactonizing enzyme family protein [Microbacterium alcoholitolerans]|uniref:mandelate racemase/muconate lactonizing enzyme family protein n=1 Tax=unclassified Microbacterium TaxID=2609290 RepID=UPI003D16A071
MNTDSVRNLRIERIETFAVRLPTKGAFSIAGGTVTTAGEPTTRVLVKLTAGDHIGWGEATPTPAWTYETTESIMTTIDRYLAPAVLGIAVWDLDTAHRRFDRAINRGISIGSPIAKGAIDLAMHDVTGRALGVPIGTLWGQRRTERIRLGWIVNADSPRQAADAIDAGRAAGYDAFKLKVGIRTPATDLAVVRAAREHAPDAQLWIDGNQGFTLDGALRLAREMADLDISAFEQPLPANALPALGRLRTASPVPIALDESLRHPSDLVTALQLDALDVAVLKAQRSAGLHLSRRMGEFAEDAGLSIMGSGLTDSELGFAASLHLFAAFGVTTAVDLNGRQFVESSYVAGEPIRVVDGVASVPEGPGLGVEVDEQVVRMQAYDPFA